MQVEHPHNGHDSRDPDRKAVYEAAEVWLYETASRGYLDSLPEYLQPEEVGPFVLKTLGNAGWDATHGPTIEFDVADDDDRAGWYSGRDQVIHLHPRLLCPSTVLHEVSHWLDPRSVHGPKFQAILVSLIDAAYGPDVSRLLLDHFLQWGLSPDPWRLPDWAEPMRRQARAAVQQRALRHTATHEAAP